MFDLSEVDPSWHSLFKPNLSHINSIFAALDGKEITPPRKDVFRAFSLPIEKVKVVILGQDPYPGVGVADGLAFSTSSPIIPPSLRNIFSEYCADLGYPSPTSGDLTQWFEEGVLLLNTSLTTEVGSRDLHKSIGWESVMSDAIEEIARRKVVAILWGNSAKRFGGVFPCKIESVHPSPLSAHRGFFGSKPFTRANVMLSEIGVNLIDWKLI